MNEEQRTELIKGLKNVGREYLSKHRRKPGSGLFGQAYNMLADWAHGNHEYARILVALDPDLGREQLYRTLISKVLKKVSPYLWGELLEGMMQQMKLYDADVAATIAFEERSIDEANTMQDGGVGLHMVPGRLERALERAVPGLKALLEGGVEMTGVAAMTSAAGLASALGATH